MTRLVHELRRRKVLRVGALYVVGAWVALQVADLAFPGLGIPGEAIRYVWIGAIAGLPIVLVFIVRLATDPGVMGSAVSLVMLKGGFELFRARLGMPGRFLGIESGVHFFSGQVAVLILVAGLVLGFVGSLVSVLDLGRAKS